MVGLWPDASMIHHFSRSPAENGSFRLSGCLFGCSAPWWVVELALLGNAVDVLGLLNLSLHHTHAGTPTYTSFFSSEPWSPCDL